MKYNINRLDITIPEKIQFSIDHKFLKFECGKFIEKILILKGVNIEYSEDKLNFNGDKQNVCSVYRRVNNIVEGFKSNFNKNILLEGTGYYVELKDNQLVFELGFNHKIYKTIYPEINVVLNSKNSITLSSHNKQKLGEFCAIIENLRFPNPYTGKGVKIIGKEYIKKQRKK